MLQTEFLRTIKYITNIIFIDMEDISELFNSFSNTMAPHHTSISKTQTIKQSRYNTSSSAYYEMCCKRYKYRSNLLTMLSPSNLVSYILANVIQIGTKSNT